MRKLFLLIFFTNLAYGKNVFSPKSFIAIWDIGTPGAITNGPGTWDTLSSQFTYDTGVFNSPFSPGSNVSFGNPLSTGAGGTVTVSGTKLINGFIFDTGPTSDYTVSGGTLSCVNGRGCTFIANQSGTIGSVITGSPPIIKDGTQTLTLSAANTYTGLTTINEGTLKLSMSNMDHNRSSGFAIASGATLALENTTTNQTRISNYQPIITGAGTILKISTGTLQMANNGSNKQTQLNMSAGGLIDVQEGLMSSISTLEANLSDINIAAGAMATINDWGASNVTAYFDKLSGAGNIRINTDVNPRTLIVGNNNGTATFSGTVGDGGVTAILSLAKAGTGTQTLSGVNTYTGVTTVSGGNLSLGDGTAGGNIIPATNLITDNATLTYNTGSAITHSGVISGTGRFIKLGTGNLTLSGKSIYSGGTTVNGGTLTLNGGGGSTTSTIKGNLTINSGGTVIARAQQWDMGYSENETEAVKLITINDGTLTFTGTNDTGGNNAAITMTNGSITGSRFDVYRPSGARTITINPGTSTISAGIRHRIPAGLTFDVATGGTLNFSGIITQDSTAGDVIKAGPGLMNMTGVNTYTDNTTISGGTFQIGGAGSLASGTAISIASGATFKYSSSTNQTLSGVISGAGSLVKDTSAVSITLSNANTYTGSTTINDGQITVYTPSGLGSTSGITIGSGATLTLNANGGGQNYTFPVTFSTSTGNLYFGQTDYARDNTWSGNITLTGSANIKGNKSGGVGRLTGIISGAGTLTLGYTAGTFYLSGNNTYTGGTTISVGTVTCQHVNALGTTGAITVNSGATLNKNATGCGGTRITCNGTCNN